MRELYRGNTLTLKAYETLAREFKKGSKIFILSYLEQVRWETQGGYVIVSDVKGLGKHLIKHRIETEGGSLKASEITKQVAVIGELGEEEYIAITNQIKSHAIVNIAKYLRSYYKNKVDYHQALLQFYSKDGFYKTIKGIKKELNLWFVEDVYKLRNHQTSFQDYLVENSTLSRKRVGDEGYEYGNETDVNIRVNVNKGEITLGIMVVIEHGVENLGREDVSYGGKITPDNTLYMTKFGLMEYMKEGNEPNSRVYNQLVEFMIMALLYASPSMKKNESIAKNGHRKGDNDIRKVFTELRLTSGSKVNGEDYTPKEIVDTVLG